MISKILIYILLHQVKFFKLFIFIIENSNYINKNYLSSNNQTLAKSKPHSTYSNNNRKSLNINKKK